MTGPSSPLLELRNVVREYPVRSLALRRGHDRVHAVSGVTLHVGTGETVALVGESGCGKSTTARLAVALERPDSGTVVFDGTDLARLHGSRLRKRRRELQMVFQDPYSSLDPRMTVGDALAEPLLVHGLGGRGERRQRVAELVVEVGLPADAQSRYPHELSGGQRQRVALARALALKPRLIVADEPVSALDVSVRAQILNLMADLQTEYGLAYLVVAHDLAIVRHVSRRAAVMYLGKIVETGPTESVVARPAHPYTAKLIEAVPEADPHVERRKHRSLAPEEIPSPVAPPSGCRFRTRCPRAQDVCAAVEPPLRPFGGSRFAACHFPLEEAEPAPDASPGP